MRHVAQDYFDELFHKQVNTGDPVIVSPVISNDDNVYLIAPFQVEHYKEAILYATEQMSKRARFYNSRVYLNSFCLGKLDSRTRTSLPKIKII
jgi:hypothetical protein